MARTGYEKILYDVFCELLPKHEKGLYALNHLDWLIFNEHKDEFYNLPESSQWEIRMYMETLRKIYGW